MLEKRKFVHSVKTERKWQFGFMIKSVTLTKYFYIRISISITQSRYRHNNYIVNDVIQLVYRCYVLENYSN